MYDTKVAQKSLLDQTDDLTSLTQIPETLAQETITRFWTAEALVDQKVEKGLELFF